MMIFPVSLCCRLFSGTLGRAAAAGSLERSRVIYKCHWQSLVGGSSQSALLCQEQDVEGERKRACGERASASQALCVCLDFSMQGTSDLTSRKRGREMPADGNSLLITKSSALSSVAHRNHIYY